MATVIILNGLDTVVIEVGDEYIDAGVSALANVDGILEPNLSSNINVSSTFTLMTRVLFCAQLNIHLTNQIARVKT
jgi:hypothetical protein